MVREYDIKVWVKVATYGSDLEVKNLSDRISERLQTIVRADPNFLVEGKPTVEVYYDPRP